MKKVLIVLGREKLHKDSILYQQLFSSFRLLFDPSDELSIMHEKVVQLAIKYPFAKSFLPALYSKWLKLRFMIRYRDFSGTYLKLFKPHFRDFEYRKAILHHFFSQIQQKYRPIVVGRSAGALLATQLADAFQIDHIVCLGYPFKHPEKEEEPYRTQHLAQLKTPTTIYQGTQDEYGKPEDLQKYSLSDYIRIVPLNASHDYQCSPSEVTQIINQLKDLLQQ